MITRDEYNKITAEIDALQTILRELRFKASKIDDLQTRLHDLRYKVTKLAVSEKGPYNAVMHIDMQFESIEYYLTYRSTHPTGTEVYIRTPHKDEKIGKIKQISAWGYKDTEGDKI